MERSKSGTKETDKPLKKVKKQVESVITTVKEDIIDEKPQRIRGFSSSLKPYINGSNDIDSSLESETSKMEVHTVYLAMFEETDILNPKIGISLRLITEYTKVILTYDEKETRLTFNEIFDIQSKKPFRLWNKSSNKPAQILIYIDKFYLNI